MAASTTAHLSSTPIPGDLVTVMIPARNEQATIFALCDSLVRLGYEVCVIDDGSEDATAAEAERAGASVLKHAAPRGKGSALRTGFSEAISRGVEWIAILDGDGQHSPVDLHRLVQFARTSRFDVTIGARSLRSPLMPVVRRWTNRIMSWFLSSVTGFHLPDSQSGMRVMRAPCLQRMQLNSSYFEIESEILLRAAALGMTIGSFPIETIYCGYRASFVRPLRDTVRWLRFLCGYLRKNGRAGFCSFIPASSNG